MSFFTPQGPLIRGSSNYQTVNTSILRAETIITPNVITTYNTGVNPAGVAISGNSAYVSNDNSYGIAGSDSVTVLNLATNLVTTTILDASFQQPYTIVIDGNIAYVTNSNSPTMIGLPGTITKIDTVTNTVIGVLGTLTPIQGGFDGPSGMVIKGRTAYVNNYGANGGVMSGNGHTVSVVNIDTGALITTIEMNDAIPQPPPAANAAPASLAITPDQNFVYVANYVDGNTGNGNVKVINTATNLVVANITGFSGPFAIAISPNGLRAYVTNFGSNNFQPYGTTVSIIDTQSNTLVKSIEAGIQPAGLVFSPDGTRAFITNYNTLYAWVANSPPYPYNVVDFPPPQYLNLTPGTGTVNIINTETETLVTPTIKVDQSPNSLAITPDGRFLVVTNYISNTCSKISL